MKDRQGEEGGDDAQAFLEAMQDVAPLVATDKQVAKKPREDTPGLKQRRDDAEGAEVDHADPNPLTLAEVPQVQPLEFLEWRQDGVQTGVFDKLRRGGYSVEGSLDLHRKTVQEARELVHNFIRREVALGHRSVLFSPGKGELSPTPARLKSYVAFWLAEHPEVIAYVSAQRQHGGVGAIYCLLKKSAASRELNREQHGLKSS